MQAIRPLLVIPILFFNVKTTLSLNPKLLGSIEDDIEVNCLKSVFEEYIRPLLSSTNGNGKILVDLPPSQLTGFKHDVILRMFHQEFAIIVSGSTYPMKQQAYSTKFDTYVMFSTNIAQVTDTIKLWKSSVDSWNPTASVLIFHNNTSESYWYLKRILMIFLKNNVLNVNVISIGTKKIEIVTWSPYDDGSCAKYIINLKIVAECILETSRYLTIYHEVEKSKLSVHVHKRCPLKVICFEWAPYSFYSSIEGSYSGFEVELLKAFAEKMHFEPTFIGVPNSSTTIKPTEMLSQG